MHCPGTKSDTHDGFYTARQDVLPPWRWWKSNWPRNQWWFVRVSIFGSSTMLLISVLQRTVDKLTSFDREGDRKHTEMLKKKHLAAFGLSRWYFRSYCCQTSQREWCKLDRRTVAMLKTFHPWILSMNWTVIQVALDLQRSTFFVFGKPMYRKVKILRQWLWSGTIQEYQKPWSQAEEVSVFDVLDWDLVLKINNGVLLRHQKTDLTNITN